MYGVSYITCLPRRIGLSSVEERLGLSPSQGKVPIFILRNSLIILFSIASLSFAFSRITLFLLPAFHPSTKRKCQEASCGNLQSLEDNHGNLYF